MSRYSNFTENLFDIYEEVTGLNLAAVFSAKSQANGQAIKKLLAAYPEEKDREIMQSWRNFLNSDDEFDKTHKDPLYWANKKVNDYWPNRPDKRAMNGTVEYSNGHSASDEICEDCLGTGWTVKSHVLHLGHTAKQYGPCPCRHGQFKGVRK